MNECNCEQVIELKRENIKINTSRTMRGVQIGELQEEIEQLKIENLKLKSENIFSDKSTIEQLRRLVKKKNCEKDRLYLQISKRKIEASKLNSVIMSKSRKIERLKQTLTDWNIVTNEGES